MFLPMVKRPDGTFSNLRLLKVTGQELSYSAELMAGVR